MALSQPSVQKMVGSGSEQGLNDFETDCVAATAIDGVAVTAIADVAKQVPIVKHSLSQVYLTDIFLFTTGEHNIEVDATPLGSGSLRVHLWTSRTRSDFIEQVGVVVQEFKQVGDRLQWFGLAALIAGKCISPSPGKQCGFLLRQFKFFSNS